MSKGSDCTNFYRCWLKERTALKNASVFYNSIGSKVMWHEVHQYFLVHNTIRDHLVDTLCKWRPVTHLWSIGTKLILIVIILFAFLMKENFLHIIFVSNISYHIKRSTKKLNNFDSWSAIITSKASPFLTWWGYHRIILFQIVNLFCFTSE